MQKNAFCCTAMLQFLAIAGGIGWGRSGLEAAPALVALAHHPDVQASADFTMTEFAAPPNNGMSGSAI